MRLRAVTASVVAVASFAVPAQADRPLHSPNMKQLAQIEVDWSRERIPDGLVEMAFKDDLLIAGIRDYTFPDNNFSGTESGVAIFRILDGPPFLRQLSVLPCQVTGEITLIGDVVVAGSLYDRTRPNTGCNRAGLQIIDISEPREPRLAKFIGLGCGVVEHAVNRHRDRWYVIAPATCDESVDHSPLNGGLFAEMAIVRIHPHNPEAAAEVGNPQNPTVGCQEVFVLVSRDLMVCTFLQTFVLFDISDPVNPIPIAGTNGTTTHSVPAYSAYAFYRGGFTWDGQYLVLGLVPTSVDWQCPNQELASLLFFDIEDKTNPVVVGDWAVPRRSAEDCFSHGLNILPMKNPDRYVLVAGFGSQGVNVVDFSDPTQPREIAFYEPRFYPHDPANPADPDPFLSTGVRVGYWYNGRVYATAEGEDAPRLRVFDVARLGSRHVHYFQGSYNPQTQLENFR